MSAPGGPFTDPFEEMKAAGEFDARDLPADEVFVREYYRPAWSRWETVRYHAARWMLAAFVVVFQAALIAAVLFEVPVTPALALTVHSLSVFIVAAFAEDWG